MIIVCGQLGPLTTIGTVGGGLIAKFKWHGVAIGAGMAAGWCVLVCIAGAFLQCMQHRRHRQRTELLRQIEPQTETSVQLARGAEARLATAHEALAVRGTE